MGPELGRAFAAIGVVGFVIFGLIALGCLDAARSKQAESRLGAMPHAAMVGCLWFFGILFVLVSLLFGGCGVAYLTGQVK